MSDCKGIHKMLDMIKKEIDIYSEKSSLTPAEWEMVFKASKAYKDLLTGCAMEEYGEDWDDDGVSGRSYNYRMSGMNEMPDYSGARRRDSMGRYSGNAMRRYPMEGYSGHSKGELLDAYYDMLEEADSEEERMMIQKKIRKLRGER